MAEPTFETIIENGKVKSRYGFMREVDYLERFKFWSANSFPQKLWLPRYSGHIVLEDEVALVRVDNRRTKEMKTYLIGIDEALQPLTLSNDIGDRLHAGAVVVRSVVNGYLDHKLVNSPAAVTKYVDLQNTDPDRVEFLRRLAVTAH